MRDSDVSLKTLFASLKRQTVLARAYMLWETYAPALAIGMLAIAIFVTASALGLWERFGDPWRLAALLLVSALIFISVFRALSLRLPTWSDAQRRLETDSDQDHRPLDTLSDRPAIAQDAWPAHYKSALAQAHKIGKPLRKHGLKPKDPYALRLIMPVILGGALLYSAGFSFERLRNAVSPQWQSGVNPSKVTFEAWIDPPAYTGRPPIYFKDGADVVVPEGSEFVARISGAASAPRPKFWQKSKSRFLNLTRLGAKSFEARTTVDSSGSAEWRIGTYRKVWALNTAPDTAPNVDFIDPPKADKRDRLVFTYSLRDDYGVEQLQIEMAEITDGLEGTALFAGPKTYADVPLSGGSVKSADKASAALDLTKHIWAGRKVTGRLIATDGAGQKSISKPVFFTVPDKIFVEPLAKAVVEHRQLVLAADGLEYEPPKERTIATGYFNTYEPELRLNRAPASIQRAALLIDAVTDAPDQIFKDPAVYMGLRNIHSRLRYARAETDLLGIPEDLWKIALRAEFGVLGTALEEMREAEAALRDGIARRAPQREVDTLFERYNLAVEAYTEELRKKAIEEGNVAEGSGSEGGPMGNVDEIQELLKAIEEANAAGDTEGARKALTKLAQLLENMEIQLSQGGGGEGGDSSDGEMSEEMKKSLEELADMMGDQRELQDETQQAEREDAQGQDGENSVSPQELAKRQEELEQLLENLNEALPEDLANAQKGQQSGSGGEGKPEAGAGQEDGAAGLEPGGSEQAEGGGNEPGPPSSGKGDSSAEGNQSTGGSGPSLSELLGNAQEAMRESQDGLEAGDLGKAGDAQAQVLRELREAGEVMAEASANQGQGQSGGDEDGDSEDPLGRPDGGANAENSEADIELKDNATRSRELLEELRRRASEQDRKKQEREYLDRLLKRF